MTSLLLATAAFLLFHTGLSSTPLRRVLVGRLGEGPYLGLYALAATAALVWMAVAFADAPFVSVRDQFYESVLRHSGRTLANKP